MSFDLEQCRPTNCIPRGRPDSVNPHGTETAGLPAALIAMLKRTKLKTSLPRGSSDQPDRDLKSHPTLRRRPRPNALLVRWRRMFRPGESNRAG